MVRIITDTTAVLPPEIARRHNIAVIPQIIHFGEESFAEGIDLDADGFLQRLTSSKQLPKTAAPPPDLFIEQFQKLATAGEPILCLHPSADVSGTVRSANLARSEFPNLDIRVLDTRTVGTPLGQMVEMAAEWAAAGESVDAILGRLDGLIPRCRIYFLVATLEYLAKGGRIGGASALVGTVLQIKPILEFRDGKVEPLERERTHKRALARLKELVAENAAPGDEARVSIMHAGVPEEGRALAKDLQAQLKLSRTPEVATVPPAIITYSGPGLLGAGFFTRE